MPHIGETRRNDKYQLYIWAKCEKCGRERWVIAFRGEPKSKNCRCFKGNKQGVGGREGDSLGHYTQRGYVLIKLRPNDFFYPMANSRGWVRENRLVMARHLGRCLQLWEVVHHKHGVAKSDNRIENLELHTIDGHNTITAMQNKIDALEKRIAELLQENNK